MSNIILTPELYASLFMQLSRLESSGIPTARSLKLLKTKDTQVNQKLVKMQHLLNSGLSIANAGFNAGIFTQTHKALVNAGENSGQLVAVYQQQAGYYQKKFSRIKKIKVQLMMPVFILLLALLIKPIPVLISGSIGLWSYLSISVGVFLSIAGLFILAYKLSVWFKPLFHQLQWQLPFINEWLIIRQVNEFFLILAFLLESGLAAIEALPLAAASINNSVLRKHFDVSIRTGQSGQSIADSLSSIESIPATAIEMIHTGEISGRLPSALLQYARHQGELIDINDDALAKWIPRWFYAVVVLGVIL